MERMEVNMKVAVMRDLNKMAFTKRPIPQPKEDEVLMGAALDKELSFKTIFCYRHIYPIAIEAVASGKVNIQGIVTNIFDFDDVQNAMDISVKDKANAVKSVIKIN